MRGRPHETLDITYFGNGLRSPGRLRAIGVAAVAKWALALEVEQAPLDETETPNNYAGGAAWHFNVNNGELTFSYADYGEGAIFINNEWYAVKSPSDPPVNE